MKSPITDAVATMIIMLALIAGGYFWLVSEADKIIQHKQEQKVQPYKVYEKSALERYAPKSFEALNKRTE